MTDVACVVHGFSHLSSTKTTIGKIGASYSNMLMKFTIDGMMRYGRLLSYVNTNVIKHQYAVEMREECPDGFDRTNHSTFTCKKRRGVIMGNTISCCQATGKHETLDVLSGKELDEDSVCCVSTIGGLTLWPTMVVGSKCILRRSHFKKYIGICKWMGKINDIECIGMEMTSWQSNDSNGCCVGSKIFDCRKGHGVLLMSRDIEMKNVNSEELEFNENGFVDLKNAYNVTRCAVKEKDLLKIGRRVELGYVEGRAHIACRHKILFGVLRWIGTINNGKCVGVELDYPCVGAMDGILSSSDSFLCDSGCGVICAIDNVVFDHYIYSVAFTVDETFNMDSNIIFKEDWNQIIAHDRDLRVNENVFVYIEKNDRILNIRGVLKWFGCIQGVSVGILEMAADFPITVQQKITHLLKDVKPLSHVIVNTKYLFKYRTSKTFENFEDDLIDFDIENKTEFGIVKWRGVDGYGHLFYGFEVEASSEECTDGTFHGQKLFQCNVGLGVLMSARQMQEIISSKTGRTREIGNRSIVPSADLRDLVLLTVHVANRGGISSDQLLSTAMEMENKSILGPLVSNMERINIFKNADVINQLLETRSFDALLKCMVNCTIERDNDKQLLHVAAESLKYGKMELFEKCMSNCTNKDTLLDSGETFVTCLIKEKVNKHLIAQAIESYELDVTQANIDNCIPLTLAFDAMMMDVVDCIVKRIKNQELRKRFCSICMDRNINTVFECGHNSCNVCAENISHCHFCKKRIVNRGVLYLN